MPGEEFKEREREDIAIKKPKATFQDEKEQIVFEGPEDVFAKSKAIEEYFAKRKKMKKILVFGTISVFLLAVIFLLGYRFYIRGGGLGFLSSQKY